MLDSSSQSLILDVTESSDVSSDWSLFQSITRRQDDFRRLRPKSSTESANVASIKGSGMWIVDGTELSNCDRSACVQEVISMLYKWKFIIVRRKSMEWTGIFSKNIACRFAFGIFHFSVDSAERSIFYFQETTILKSRQLETETIRTTRESFSFHAMVFLLCSILSKQVGVA